MFKKTEPAQARPVDVLKKLKNIERMRKNEDGDYYGDEMRQTKKDLATELKKPESKRDLEQIKALEEHMDAITTVFEIMNSK